MKIVTWMLSILLAIVFFGAGFAKLTGAPMMVSEFQIFGYPLAFMYFTGALEIVAGVLVLIPRMGALGAGIISCIMVGALFSHLTHGQATYAIPVVILLALALVLGKLRNWATPFTTTAAHN